MEIAGIVHQPYEKWMKRITRNLIDCIDGFLLGTKYLIHDLDPLFCTSFKEMLADAGVNTVKLPPRSPNLNAQMERYMRSLKSECLERMIFFGEQS